MQPYRCSVAIKPTHWECYCFTNQTMSAPMLSNKSASTILTQFSVLNSVRSLIKWTGLITRLKFMFNKCLFIDLICIAICWWRYAWVLGYDHCSQEMNDDYWSDWCWSLILALLEGKVDSEAGFSIQWPAEKLLELIFTNSGWWELPFRKWSDSFFFLYSKRRRWTLRANYGTKYL